MENSNLDKSARPRSYQAVSYEAIRCEAIGDWKHVEAISKSALCFFPVIPGLTRNPVTLLFHH
jgi:hypothetical protein